MNCQKTLMDMSIQFKTLRTTIKNELKNKKDILPELKMHWKQKKLYCQIISPLSDQFQGTKMLLIKYNLTNYIQPSMRSQPL